MNGHLSTIEQQESLLRSQERTAEWMANSCEKTSLEDLRDFQGDAAVENGPSPVPLPAMSPAEENMFRHQNDDLRAFFELEWDKSCYMSDGKRQIDFVLAYEDDEEARLPSASFVANGEKVPEPSQSESGEYDTESDEDPQVSPSAAAVNAGQRRMTSREKRNLRRKHYEDNLEKMGLQLERVEISPDLGRTRFTLVHAPFTVLERQAQLLSVKLPVKRSDVYFQNRRLLPGPIDRVLHKVRVLDFDDEKKKLFDEPDFFTAPYTSDRRQQFVNWDRPDLLFPVAERCRMVYDLLTRAHYDDASRRRSTQTSYRFGIERLLASYTYHAAFPLHQELRSRAEMNAADDEHKTQREMLYLHWASWRNLFKYQPLDSIKRYFGTKVAFYFSWLGYYTRSLYPAALAGFICVFFGLIRIDNDVVSNDICGSDGIGSSTIICPQCESYCDYQYLNSSCVYSKMTYLFDNGMTVVFAALMSIWATLFLEGWKRYHAEIAWKWGLLDFVVEEDTVRPDFQFRVRTTAYNPITQKDEPYLSGKKKLANFCASGATVVFFVCLVLAVVFGMIVYRVICMQLLSRLDNEIVDTWAFLIVSSTAATINLIVIMFMSYFYNELALWLTAWECPRTQSDFDNSYTFKVFLFQFVNYYSSLFYVAFFKGIVAQVPGTKDESGNVKIGGYRLEGCDPAGCFVELFIQLAIIMCGRQFFSAIIEMAYPYLMSLLRKWHLRVPQVVESKEQKTQRLREENREKAGKLNRWEADYYLNPTFDQFLFDEYLEMVLQFGFVTLFVAAFPLAPFFAVINNVLEIRLDAYKFLVNNQRPIPHQARNIGVWFNILDVISRMSVTTNALVIAFTSDFVPKTLYWFSHDHSMQGYVNASLSYYDADTFTSILRTSHFQNQNVSICRFRGYRRTPCSISNVTISNMSDGSFQEVCDDSLGLSYEWWRVLAVRLLFVVVFEHVVYLVKILFEYFIPDVPTKIFVHQQREKYLLRKALLSDFNSKQTPTQQFIDGEDSERTAFQPGSFGSDKGEAELRHRAPMARESTSLESYETAELPDEAWQRVLSGQKT